VGKVAILTSPPADAIATRDDQEIACKKRVYR